MHTAAPQMRARPDSATSTPSGSSVSTCAVRSMRSCTCDEVAVSTPSAIAPNANTPSSRFQPSSCHPENTSTNPNVSQAARAPASSTTSPTAAAASNQPALPKRLAAACSANGERLATTTPSFRLQGPSTPLRRSTRAVSATGHIGCPLMACLIASIVQNSGLVPASACNSASTVHTPTITPSPPNVTRRLWSSATAAATSHRKGR